MLYLALALAAALQAQPRTSAQVQAPIAPAQLESAEARYRSAIALNPNIAAYHASLALVLERKGQLTEAIVEHRSAVRLDSVSGRNRAGLGSLLRRQGQVDEAIIHLTAAAAVDPGSVPIRMELAQALVAAKRNADALTILERARGLAPDDSSVARAIADIGPIAAPGEGYHDYSGFADDAATGRWFRRAIERVFAVLLGVAGLALVGPIAGGILVLLAELPRRLVARRPA